METGSTTVGVNLHHTVQCGGVQKGGIDEWEYAWNKYQNTSSPTEKSILQNALACSQDMDILSMYLIFALNTSKIRQQDSDSVISDVAYQRSGSYLALNYVIDHWDQIQKSIGTQPFVMENLITDTTWWISTQTNYDLVSRFFSSVKALTAQRTLKQALEDILMRITWRKKYEKQVSLWFKEATNQRL
ncbi:aminopeptidase N-like [Lytechinus pictus]|uniref:aminopeptidase N-like n=1 Tax=Lytechinus pictus TaxID=7653 RepID=UPI0030BA1985